MRLRRVLWDLEGALLCIWHEECQQQIDELQAGQAQQNEQLAAQAQEIEALKNKEDVYNPWYVRGAFKFGWGF